MSFILRHRGVQLILAYSWARPAILVASKSRGELGGVGGGGGGGGYFFCFFTFIPVPLSFLSLSFIFSTVSSISFLPFSGRRHKMTTRVDVSLNPSTIKNINNVPSELYGHMWFGSSPTVARILSHTASC